MQHLSGTVSSGGDGGDGGDVLFAEDEATAMMVRPIHTHVLLTKVALFTVVYAACVCARMRYERDLGRPDYRGRAATHEVLVRLLPSGNCNNNTQPVFFVCACAAASSFSGSVVIDLPLEAGPRPDLRPNDFDARGLYTLRLVLSDLACRPRSVC